MRSGAAEASALMPQVSFGANGRTHELGQERSIAAIHAGVLSLRQGGVCVQPANGRELHKASVWSAIMGVSGHHEDPSNDDR